MDPSQIADASLRRMIVGGGVLDPYDGPSAFIEWVTDRLDGSDDLLNDMCPSISRETVAKVLDFAGVDLEEAEEEAESGDEDSSDDSSPKSKRVDIDVIINIFVLEQNPPKKGTVAKVRLYQPQANGRVKNLVKGKVRVKSGFGALTKQIDRSKLNGSASVLLEVTVKKSQQVPAFSYISPGFALRLRLT